MAKIRLLLPNEVIIPSIMETDDSNNVYDETLLKEAVKILEEHDWKKIGYPEFLDTWCAKRIPIIGEEQYYQYDISFHPIFHALRKAIESGLEFYTTEMT